MGRKEGRKEGGRKGGREKGMERRIKEAKCVFYLIIYLFYSLCFDPMAPVSKMEVFREVSLRPLVM